MREDDICFIIPTVFFTKDEFIWVLGVAWFYLGIGLVFNKKDEEEECE